MENYQENMTTTKRVNNTEILKLMKFTHEVIYAGIILLILSKRMEGDVKQKGGAQRPRRHF